MHQKRTRQASKRDFVGKDTKMTHNIKLPFKPETYFAGTQKRKTKPLKIHQEFSLQALHLYEQNLVAANEILKSAADMKGGCI